MYKKKHGKPPVIIYDNVDYLVGKHSKILDLLQNDAKKSADDKNILLYLLAVKIVLLEKCIVSVFKIFLIPFYFITAIFIEI